VRGDYFGIKVIPLPLRQPPASTKGNRTPLEEKEHQERIRELARQAAKKLRLGGKRQQHRVDHKPWRPEELELLRSACRSATGKRKWTVAQQVAALLGRGRGAVVNCMDRHQLWQG
jgi:hypothetical protein